MVRIQRQEDSNRCVIELNEPFDIRHYFFAGSEFLTVFSLLKKLLPQLSITFLLLKHVFTLLNCNTSCFVR